MGIGGVGGRGFQVPDFDETPEPAASPVGEAMMQGADAANASGGGISLSERQGFKVAFRLLDRRDQAAVLDYLQKKGYQKTYETCRAVAR